MATYKNNHFLFNPPNDEPDISLIANAAIRVAALASRLVQEERATMCRHLNGRVENVAEHSHMLSVVAPAIAEEFYPSLNANLISRYASIHDAVEAYVGDTHTYAISKKDYLKKGETEKLGLKQLKKDYAVMPKFVKLIVEYEKQNSAEARFVRMVDKWTTLLMHFAENGKSLKELTNRAELEQNILMHREFYLSEYADFKDVIQVREELVHLAIRRFYE